MDIRKKFPRLSPRSSSPTPDIPQELPKHYPDSTMIHRKLFLEFPLSKRILFGYLNGKDVYIDQIQEAIFEENFDEIIFTIIVPNYIKYITYDFFVGMIGGIIQENGYMGVEKHVEIIGGNMYVNKQIQKYKKKIQGEKCL